MSYIHGRFAHVPSHHLFGSASNASDVRDRRIVEDRTNKQFFAIFNRKRWLECYVTMYVYICRLYFVVCLSSIWMGIMALAIRRMLYDTQSKQCNAMDTTDELNEHSALHTKSLNGATNTKVLWPYLLGMSTSCSTLDRNNRTTDRYMPACLPVRRHMYADTDWVLKLLHRRYCAIVEVFLFFFRRHIFAWIAIAFYFVSLELFSFRIHEWPKSNIVM